MFNFKGKRGQVVIFIIAGILIAVLLVVLLGVKKTLIKEEAMPAEKEKVAESKEITNFIDLCLQQATKQGLLTIAGQGGYNTPPEDSLMIFLDNIPYYYINGEIKNSAPNLNDELKDYITKNLPKCLGDFSAFKSQGIEVTGKAMSITANFAENSVVVELFYPLAIKSKGKTSKLERFIHSRTSKMKEMLSISQDIAKSYAANPGKICLSCLQDISQNIDPQLSINIVPLFDELTGLEALTEKPTDVFVVTITDESFKVGEGGNLVYRFVLQNPAVEGKEPLKLKEIPQQTAFSGQEFNLDIETTGNAGRLVFSDETELFEIDSATGKISFTPTEDQKGAYVIIINVKDENENEDMEVFEIEIK